MLMPLRVQWLVQPSVYTRRPCHIRSTHIACVYRPEFANTQTSQWLDHAPCRCASPSPFAAVRREIEHQSLARQHSLAHGVPAVLPQSFSLGRQFLPRRRPIADTPASLRPAPCPMPPAPRIPACSERITGLPKGHDRTKVRRHPRRGKTSGSTSPTSATVPTLLTTPPAVAGYSPGHGPPQPTSAWIPTRYHQSSTCIRRRLTVIGGVRVAAPARMNQAHVDPRPPGRRDRS